MVVIPATVKPLRLIVWAEPPLADIATLFGFGGDEVMFLA